MESKTKICIVEDEGIVAKDLEHRLTTLGYAVVGVTSYGEEALDVARESKANLVLMDIYLKGKKDGIDAAGEIRDQLNLPVIFLTAFADQKTLEKAKITEPFGYILKPFEERTLQSHIEMALYKHKMESKRREREEWIETVLNSVGESVIATDLNGMVSFMNPAAEDLTGWEESQWKNAHADQLLKVSDEEGRPFTEGLVELVLKTKKPSFSVNLNFTTYLGVSLLVECSIAPLFDHRDTLSGTVIVLRDVSKRRKAEKDLFNAKAQFDSKVRERTQRLRQSKALLKKEIEIHKQKETALEKGRGAFQNEVSGVYEHYLASSQKDSGREN